MNAFRTGAAGRGRRHWGHAATLALAAWGAVAVAQIVSVPDAHLNHAEGSVAHAPAGEPEWQDIAPLRQLARGDRLWTDRGSRAEVQAGGHALRLDGQTQLALETVSDTATQLSLTQGSVVATVTRVDGGDSFEVGTPNLALRAREPGDYRIDVDPKAGTTRVQVLAGSAVVYGEKGEVLELRKGQRATFGERSLARVKQPLFVASDDFARWAGARSRGEPTVRMPALATAPSAPTKAPEYNGRTIIIGPASSQASARAPVLRVGAPGSEPAAPPALAPAPAPEQAQAQRVAPQQEQQERAAAARAQAQAQAQRTKVAAQRAREQREAASARAQQQERRTQEAKRISDHRRAVLAQRAEQEQRRAQARQAKQAESEQRQLQARRAAEEKRLAQARRVEAQKQAAARKLEEQKLAEARKRQLARLQEQAGREVQAARQAQARRDEQARLAQAQRQEEQARREEQGRAEEMARREDDARREAADRRHRAVAEQSRRDQQRREQEVWLRQQPLHQPVRPAPMGVPARRVS